MPRFGLTQKKKSSIPVTILVGLAFIAIFAGLVRWESPLNASSDGIDAQLIAEPQHRQTSKAVVRLVDSFHYRNRPLDNEFSNEILQEYLDALDPNRSYFRSTDIQKFNSYRFYMDDFLRSGKLDKIYEIFSVFKQRVAERTEFAKSLLGGVPFDFQLDEALSLDWSQSDWSFNQVEYDNVWRQIVKNEYLKLKISGAEEAEIAETLMQRYDRYQKIVSLTNSDDVFETFLNSYLRSIEPHSEYFSPHNSKNLAISLTSQIEGIGAMLRTDSNHTIIHSVIPGGPAARSTISPGDKIVGIAQNHTEAFVEITGWRLNDVVDMIRGPRGTVVRLQVIPKDEMPGLPPVVVTLIRDKVQIEDQIAKKSTVEIWAHETLLRIGVVSLPAFYSGLSVDGGTDAGRDAASSSADVKRILEELKDQHVDGVVLDLRGNGGGALQEAVKLTGLFIEDGPVVQVRSADGDTEVIKDRDSRVTYDGPLAVLVDRASASASEIVAAAIKDYKRGIIVGETTFGKGGIQTVWPLSELTKLDDSGNIKITTAQYYRVNGPSTQHVGVSPDIIFPTDEFAAGFGERALEHSLPQSVITPTEIRLWHDAHKIESNLLALRKLHHTRTELNPVFDYLANDERIKRLRAEQTVVNLNESVRKQAQDEFRGELLDNINDLRLSLGMEPVEEYGESAFPSEQIGDVFLDEAVNVVADLIATDEANTLEALPLGSNRST